MPAIVVAPLEGDDDLEIGEPPAPEYAKKAATMFTVTPKVSSFFIRSAIDVRIDDPTVFLKIFLLPDRTLGQTAGSATLPGANHDDGIGDRGATGTVNQLSADDR